LSKDKTSECWHHFENTIHKCFTNNDKYLPISTI